MFTKDQENSINEYCTALALLGNGLSSLQVRELGFEVAQRNNLRCPDTWTRHEMAGRDWFKGKYPQSFVMIDNTYLTLSSSYSITYSNFVSLSYRFYETSS